MEETHKPHVHNTDDSDLILCFAVDLTHLYCAVPVKVTLKVGCRVSPNINSQLCRIGLSFEQVCLGGLSEEDISVLNLPCTDGLFYSLCQSHFELF